MTVWSHSRISSFEDCPKKYEFAYVLKAPKGPGSIETFMGSRVHEALEWLYAEVRALHAPTADEVVATYDAAWDASVTGAEVVVREGRTAEDYRRIGEKCLRDYHERYAPFDDGVTVGLEMRLEFPLGDDEGAPHAIGYIDRLTKAADGVWEIHDYKTGNTLMTQQKADTDRQLALYAYAVRRAYPDAREIDLVWHYLAFDQEVRSSRTPTQTDELVRETADRAREIEAATEFPTRTSSLCDWCEYRGICPAWVRVDELAGMPADELAAQDDVALVDRYLELVDRASAAAAERDAARDAVIARADRDGAEQMAGTASLIKVFRYTAAKLPGREDSRRTEVERILADDGLLEGYRTTDWFALGKAIGDRRLPEATLERLAPYVTIERGAKLYPRARR